MDGRVRGRGRGWGMGKIFPPIDFAQHDTSISFSESISSAVFATSETLTLFYTRGLEIVVSHVMVPLPYRFSLGFFT